MPGFPDRVQNDEERVLVERLLKEGKRVEDIRAALDATGEIVRFDKGEPGQPGYLGRDHYHRENPSRLIQGFHTWINGATQFPALARPHIPYLEFDTSIITDAGKINFHNCGVNDIVQQDQHIQFTLESIREEPGLMNGVLSLQHVRIVLREDVEIDALTMEADAGEILTLDGKDDGVRLIMQWSSSGSGRSYTVAYRLIGNDIAAHFVKTHFYDGDEA